MWAEVVSLNNNRFIRCQNKAKKTKKTGGVKKGKDAEGNKIGKGRQKTKKHRATERVRKQDKRRKT